MVFCIWALALNEPTDSLLHFGGSAVKVLQKKLASIDVLNKDNKWWILVAQIHAAFWSDFVAGSGLLKISDGQICSRDDAELSPMPWRLAGSYKWDYRYYMGYLRYKSFFNYKSHRHLR